MIPSLQSLQTLNLYCEINKKEITSLNKTLLSIQDVRSHGNPELDWERCFKHGKEVKQIISGCSELRKFVLNVQVYTKATEALQVFWDALFKAWFGERMPPIIEVYDWGVLLTWLIR